MVGLMGRVGAAGDNAVMGSFFALMQKNVLDRGAWQTRQELGIAIVTLVARTRRRQHGSWPIDSRRVRNHHDHTRDSDNKSQPVTRSCSSPGERVSAPASVL